jgi:hypothetical protein
MNPGRDLDALVAEKVMGFRWARPLKFTHEGIEQTGVAMTEDATYVLPHYSTDIAAAWQAVEKLLAQGFGVEILSDQGQWSVQFWNLGRQTEYGDSAQHAICLAALKAVDAPRQSHNPA